MAENPLPRTDARLSTPPVSTPPSDDAAALEAVLALADAAHAADGHPPLSDQTRVVLGRGGQAWWGLTHDADGSLTGAAILVAPDAPDAPAVVELVVAPEHRRAGLGAALAEATAAAARERGWSDRVAVWAHGMLPGSEVLAARHGLVPVRELRRMRLEADRFDALPAPAMPEGVRLRGFERGRDEEAWLDLNRAAFADHPEQGRLTRADLEDRMAEEWFEDAGLLLAEREADGALLAFHWTKAEGAEGEVYVVGVSPAAQGMGLGRAITLAGLHHLVGRGVEAIDLYVDADNAAAVPLYESLGFRLLAADAQYEPTGRG